MTSKIFKFGFQKVIPSLFKASVTSTEVVSQRTFASQEEEGICIAKKEVESFIERSMMAVGTKRSHAACVADNLTMADHRGYLSHGLNRLGKVTYFCLLPVKLIYSPTWECFEYLVTIFMKGKDNFCNIM